MRVGADLNTVFWFVVFFYCAATLASQIVPLRRVCSYVKLLSAVVMIFWLTWWSSYSLLSAAWSALFMRADCTNEASCKTPYYLRILHPLDRCCSSTASLHSGNVSADHCFLLVMKTDAFHSDLFAQPSWDSFHKYNVTSYASSYPYHLPSSAVRRSRIGLLPIVQLKGGGLTLVEQKTLVVKMLNLDLLLLLAQSYWWQILSWHESDFSLRPDDVAEANCQNIHC